MDSSYVYSSLRVDPSVAYCIKTQSLVTIAPLPERVSLMSISSNQCLSLQNISPSFRTQVKLRENYYHRKYQSKKGHQLSNRKPIRGQSEKACVNDTKIDGQTLLLLYLIELKCKYILESEQKMQTDTQNMIDTDYPYLSSKNFTEKVWLSAKSAGFSSFSRLVIKHSNDEDLWIQYNAYLNFHKQFSSNIFSILTINSLQGFDANNKESAHDINIDRFLRMIKGDFERWHKVYMWAVQFKNTRAFGYTKETTLIPWFDYMNYDPKAPPQNQFQVESELREFQPKASQLLKTYRQSARHDRKTQETESDSQGYDCSQSLESQEGEQPLYSNQSPKTYHIRAISSIEKGANILFQYGSVSNRYLLKWYGFTAVDNPYDTLTMRCNFEIKANFKNNKCIVFEKKERGYRNVKVKKGRICLKLLRMARSGFEIVTRERQQRFKSVYCNYQAEAQNLLRLIEVLHSHRANLPRAIWQDLNQYITQNQSKDLKKVKEQIKWIDIYQSQMFKVYDEQIQTLKVVSEILNGFGHQNDHRDYDQNHMKIRLRKCLIENKVFNAQQYTDSIC